MRRRSRMLLVLTAAVVFAVPAVTLTATGQVADAHPPLSDAEAEGSEQLTVQPDASTGHCGVERWAVKTGTDTDAGKIGSATTPTTIAALSALPAPATLPAASRVAPTETTRYVIDATLTQYKLESDSDYHLVIRDSTGRTMITEIPDPACVGASSPLRAAVVTTRAAFDARYSPTSTFQTANVPVKVTGVGFFDFLHGQTGVAPNGIELHAVTAITVNPGAPARARQPRPRRLRVRP